MWITLRDSSGSLEKKLSTDKMDFNVSKRANAAFGLITYSLGIKSAQFTYAHNYKGLDWVIYKASVIFDISKHKKHLNCESDKTLDSLREILRLLLRSQTATLVRVASPFLARQNLT